MNFTIASYNIHKCAGLDGRVDLDRIADVIREIDADLIGQYAFAQGRQLLGLLASQLLQDRCRCHQVERSYRQPRRFSPESCKAASGKAIKEGILL